MAQDGMIPEPINKKGAFAPFNHCALFFIFIIRTN